jgi:hypothetical protein
LRNHKGQEAVVQGQGTETEIIGGEVAAGAEKDTGTGSIEAEAEHQVQVLTTEIIVELEMLRSSGARVGAEAGVRAKAEAGVEAAHTIAVHLLGAVLALVRAQPDT